MLKKYLEDLEHRLCAKQEDELESKWIEFAQGQQIKGPFCPKGRVPAPSGIEWPDIYINDVLQDEELMLLSQFKICSDQLTQGSNLLLSVRANYGTGIVPSFFGSEIYTMPYEMNCLPYVKPLNGELDAIKNNALSSLPKLHAGYGDQIFSFARRLKEIHKQYPKIRRYIRTDHPDCQGPFQIAEMLWGSEIYYALYDEPDLVHEILRQIVLFYQMLMDAWFDAMPPRDMFHAYFGRLHRGLITLRDDSVMNLSLDLCMDFVHTYDEQLLDYYKGGAIHFCGRGDHYLANMVKSKHLFAIDLSQPHLNDMEKILSLTVDQGINLHTVQDDKLDNYILSRHNSNRLSII